MSLVSSLHMMFVLVLAVACNADSKAATPPTPAPPPASAAKAVEPSPVANPVLAAGESFLDGDAARVAWTVGGKRAEVRLVKRADSMIARIYVEGDERFDVLTTRATDIYSLRVVGQNVAFESSLLVGRAPEVGGLFSNEAALIGWSSAAREPILLQQWSCDDTDGPVCERPVWLDGKTLGQVQPSSRAQTQPAGGLTEKQARKTATAWLEAAFAENPKATVALMADPFTVSTSSAGFYLKDGCSEFVQTVARAQAAACAIEILAASDRKLIGKLRARAYKPAEDQIPAGPLARVFDAKLVGESTAATIIVDVVDGSPRVTAASIAVTGH